MTKVKGEISGKGTLYENMVHAQKSKWQWPAFEFFWAWITGNIQAGYPWRWMNCHPCFVMVAKHLMEKDFDLYRVWVLFCVRVQQKFVSKTCCFSIVDLKMMGEHRKRIFRFWKIIQMSFYFINKYLVFFISMLLIILILIHLLMFGDINCM